MSEKKMNLRNLVEGFEAAKRDLPMLLGNQAQNYFAASWRNQAWNNTPWQEVQRRDPNSKVYKYSKPAARTRAILVKSGRMRRAVMNSVRDVSFEKTRLVVDVPYAEFHNDGVPGRLPQRRFMGETEELKQMQLALITKRIDQALK